MADTSWDEIGQRFADLGTQLEKVWREGRTDDRTADELKAAGEKVKAALDDVAETINRAADSPDVREAARSATTGVADALATTLRQVVDWLEKPRP